MGIDWLIGNITFIIELYIHQYILYCENHFPTEDYIHNKIDKMLV